MKTCLKMWIILGILRNNYLTSYGQRRWCLDNGSYPGCQASDSLEQWTHPGRRQLCGKKKIFRKYFLQNFFPRVGWRGLCATVRGEGRWWEKKFTSSQQLLELCFGDCHQIKVNFLVLLANGKVNLNPADFWRKKTYTPVYRCRGSLHIKPKSSWRNRMMTKLLDFSDLWPS